MTTPKRYDHLQTKIKRLEEEYRRLMESTTPTTSAELSRIEEIEQLIPYVHNIKWEIVKQRLNQPINVNQY
jgi:cell division protein FtsL